LQQQPARRRHETYCDGLGSSETSIRLDCSFSDSSLFALPAGGAWIEAPRSLRKAPRVSPDGTSAGSKVRPPSARAKDFVSWRPYLRNMEGRCGATAPSLFRRGRRCGEPDSRGRLKIASEGGSVHKQALRQLAHRRRQGRGIPFNLHENGMLGRLDTPCDIAINVREPWITTTPSLDCAQRSNG
jgi:hypothetical protein